MEIRLIQPNEYEEANELYNSFYGRKRSLKEFLWEFVDCPEGSSIFVVATEQDRIVGTHAVIPIKMIDSKGNHFMSGKSEEVLVLPDHRAGFTFLKIDDFLFKECAKRGIYYIWGLANLEVHHKLMRFDNPFQAWQGICVFNPIKAYAFLSKLNENNTSKERIKIAIFSGISFMKNLLFRTYGVEKLKKGDYAEISRLWRYENSPITYYSLNFSESFLNWRLRENPFANSYVGYSYSHEGKTLACAIVNYKHENFAYIEHLLFTDVCPMAHKKQFVRNLVFTLRKDEVDFIRYMGYNTNPLNKEQIFLFRCAGGIFAKRGMKFWWKTLKNAPRTIDLQNIFMSRLYTQGNN